MGRSKGGRMCCSGPERRNALYKTRYVNCFDLLPQKMEETH